MRLRINLHPMMESIRERGLRLTGCKKGVVTFKVRWWVQPLLTLTRWTIGFLALCRIPLEVVM